MEFGISARDGSAARYQPSQIGRSFFVLLRGYSILRLRLSAPALRSLSRHCGKDDGVLGLH
jgi:hypothetical protein